MTDMADALTSHCLRVNHDSPSSRRLYIDDTSTLLTLPAMGATSPVRSSPEIAGMHVALFTTHKTTDEDMTSAKKPSLAQHAHIRSAAAPTLRTSCAAEKHMGPGIASGAPTSAGTATAVRRN